MKLYNLTSGNLLAEKVKMADRFWLRLRGLAFYPEFPGGTGALILKPCNSVHTFFMRFPIDVIFASKALTVLYCLENMERGKISPVIKEAVYAVEVPAGMVARSGTKAGHRLALLDEE